MGLMWEEVIAAIKEAENGQLNSLLCAAAERFGSARMAMAMAMMGHGEQAKDPFLEGLISASEMPPANPPSPCWFGMYPGRVTLLIGETGAGKSSLLLNVAVHAALGEPLWDFGFPGKQRVLYIDPENSGSYRDGEREGGLCGLKIERIGKGKPDNLSFHDGRGVNLSDVSHMVALKELITRERYGLVILDPIANLFNTDDENSNAEAARQGKALIALSRETGAAVVVAHHTGKDNTGNYGRGASARLGAADVGMMFRANGPNGEADDTYTGKTRQRTDTCRLQIVKDRPNWFGHSSRYLMMAGDDRFDLSTFEDWKSARKEGRSDKTAQAEEEITNLMHDEAERTRSEISEAMRAEGMGRNAVDTALQNLVNQKVLSIRTAARGQKCYKISRETGEV